MLATLVVFDPESALSTAFVADTSIPCAVTRVDRADDARRLARHAAVVVIVATEDVATTLGFLASVVQRRDARLVVFAADAVRQHHVILHALRRGAIVLIQQLPSVLVGCVRDLIESMQPPREVA
jgi:chemotaxis response regulator CheB